MISKGLLKEFNISCVDYDNIVSTGANVGTLNIGFFVKLQRFYDIIGTEFYIMKNGLNSGKHTPDGAHYDCLAGDLAFYVEVDPYKVYKAAVQAGFLGIGVYWNGKVYSFHLDTRASFGSWGAKKVNGSWQYYGLFRNPKDI